MSTPSSPDSLAPTPPAPAGLASFDAYLASLGPLGGHSDPTEVTAESTEIKAAVKSLTALPVIDAESVAEWVRGNPADTPVLGLTVGLSREKLKNVLKHHFGTASWNRVAAQRPDDLVAMLDSEFDLLRLLRNQLHRTYDFGDILTARAGSRHTATRAGASGRRVEDEIEAIATGLGLAYETRTRFVGRNGRTAPCDLVIPNGTRAEIAVAAKGFDSTGSKLTDAVREVEEMAEVRLPRQFIMAIIDGIGWKSRVADLRRIFELRAANQIDGVYTLASLDRFRADLVNACRLRGLGSETLF